MGMYGDGEDGHGSSLSGKVLQLEQTLKIFRAEVDMKMKIMEQILTTRNEQFIVQKKLLEREHALYESVMAHWKNTAQLAQSGLSLHFSEGNTEATILMDDTGGTGLLENTVEEDPSPISHPVSSPSLRRASKRKLNANSTPAAKTSRENEDGLEIEFGTSATYAADDTCEDRDNNLFEQEETDMEEGLNSDDGGGSDEDWENPEDPLAESGMEKKVFLNIPNEDESLPYRGVAEGKGTIWTHFLLEENGTALMCKKCDENNFQKIYQIKNGNMGALYRHLKNKHGVHLEIPKKDRRTAKSGGTRYGGNGRRKRTYLRHEDRLYVHYQTKGCTEYWRCRDRGCCRGKLHVRSGVYDTKFEHTCFITPLECDVFELKEKIFDAALTSLDIPPRALLARFKKGVQQEILQGLNDDSLCLSIRKKRKSMEPKRLAKKVTSQQPDRV